MIALNLLIFCNDTQIICLIPCALTHCQVGQADLGAAWVADFSGSLEVKLKEFWQLNWLTTNYILDARDQQTIA